MKKILRYTIPTIVFIFFLFVSPSQAATYTVTKTADTNDGTCDSDCSLREAVAISNSNPGADTIEFNIPKSDVNWDTELYPNAFRIHTTISTYSLNDTVYINGKSQTLFTGDTNIRIIEPISLPLVSNCTRGPEIIITANIGARAVFNINAPNIKVEGIGVYDLSLDHRRAFSIYEPGTDFTLLDSDLIRNLQGGINVNSGVATRMRIENNVFRENETVYGRDVIEDPFRNSVIKSNEFVNNGAHAIAMWITIADPGTSIIEGNLFKTNGMGTNENPSAISFKTNEKIIFRENIVIGNSKRSIIVVDPNGVVTLSRNSISDNEILSIDLVNATDGETYMTPNDVGDLDSGPNDLMNYPIIKKVKVASGNRMYVTMDLNFNLLESPYTLEFFDNDQLSPMGYAQGKYYIGSVTTSQVGNDITLVVPITGRVPTSGALITSTATNGNGSTSEFSPTPTDPVLVIDTVASKPVIQSIGLVNNILDRDTLYVYFTSQRPLIKGSTEANSTVIFKKGSNTYTTTSDTQGKFNIELNLDRGENILEYYTVDSLVNESIHRKLTLMIGTEYFPDTLLVKLGLLTPEVEEEEPEEEETPPIVEEDIPIEQPEEEKKEISVRITLQFLDGEGKPLQSATVVIEGEEYVTNSEGEIQVDNLDVSKKYKAKVSHNGVEYETEVLGLGDVQNRVEVQLTEENIKEGIDWGRVLMYVGIGALIVIILGVLIKISKKSSNQ